MNNHSEALMHFWPDIQSMEEGDKCVFCKATGAGSEDSKCVIPRRKGTVFECSTVCKPFCTTRSNYTSVPPEKHEDWGLTFDDTNSVLSAIRTIVPEVFLMEQVAEFDGYFASFREKCLALQHQGKPIFQDMVMFKVAANENIAGRIKDYTRNRCALSSAPGPQTTGARPRV